MAIEVPLAVTQRVWLSVAEASACCGVGRTEMYAALQTGELVGSQRGKGGKWRIHVDDLNSWMRSGVQVS